MPVKTQNEMYAEVNKLHNELTEFYKIEANAAKAYPRLKIETDATNEHLHSINGEYLKVSDLQTILEKASKLNVDTIKIVRDETDEGGFEGYDFDAVILTEETDEVYLWGRSRAISDIISRQVHTLKTKLQKEVDEYTKFLELQKKFND